MRGSKYLQDVANTPAGADSIKNAITNVALCGTSLNPALKKAYLVPRKVNGVMLCCLDMSYIGLAGIAMDSGSVKHIAPRLVYTFDKFEYSETDGKIHIQHTPEMKPPAEFCDAKFWDYLVCGYVVATLHDGTKIITQPLPKWKIEKAMRTSMTTSDKTPWRTFPDEMACKTLIKHAYKLLPQTDRMSEAVSVLNEHEGLDTDKAAALVKDSQKAGILSRFMAETVNTETGEVIDVEVVADPVINLQSVYQSLDDLSKIKGESADDLLNALTKGTYKNQQDLDAAGEKDIIRIHALLTEELSKESGDLFK